MLRRMCSFALTVILLLLSSVDIVNGWGIHMPINTRTSTFDQHKKTCKQRYLDGSIKSFARQRLMASLQSNDVIGGAVVTDQEEKDPMSPAAVFGYPLDEATKKQNKELIHSLKNILFDQLFAGASIDRDYARFYALETIARMPYFSYVSVLHLFETLGYWRKADYLKVHFSETWNELHHLLIMESLGGNDRWVDRLVAQHIAFGYYWMIVICYMINPSFAYNLNQNVEEEAYTTYDKFLQKHKDYLLNQPAPDIAVEYYTGGDLYLFDEMHFKKADNNYGDIAQSSQTKGGRMNEFSNDKHERQRRPKIENLYDVFVAIRDDELEHAKTMSFMQVS